MTISISLILASCGNTESYNVAIKNNSEYEILEFKLWDYDNITIPPNETSNIFTIQPSALSEGLGYSVRKYQHPDIDSIKIHDQDIGKFRTWSSLSDSRLITINIKVDFNKTSMNQNDYIIYEITN